MPTLKEVARDFALGQLTLEDLREAALAERIHRETAQEILKLIGEWANSPRSRNELRMRVKELVPPPPRRNEGETFYDAGLRPYRRGR